MVFKSVYLKMAQKKTTIRKNRSLAGHATGGCECRVEGLLVVSVEVALINKRNKEIHLECYVFIQTLLTFSYGNSVTYIVSSCSVDRINCSL